MGPDLSEKEPGDGYTYTYRACSVCGMRFQLPSKENEKLSHGVYRLPNGSIHGMPITWQTGEVDANGLMTCEQYTVEAVHER